jgi:hypothetical protein
LAVEESALLKVSNSFLVGDFFEARMRGEVVDVVPAIQQAALVSVDEANVGRRDDDVFEAGFPYRAHGDPSDVRDENAHACIIGGRTLQRPRRPRARWPRLRLKRAR